MLKALIIIVAAVAFGYFAYLQFDAAFGEDRERRQQPVACTMEAKMCPDGTAVGRTGPNCEFAACPGE